MRSRSSRPRRTSGSRSSLAWQRPSKTPKTEPERFFGELKRWTVRAYYTSKIGIHLDQEYKGNVYQRGNSLAYDAT